MNKKIKNTIKYFAVIAVVVVFNVILPQINTVKAAQTCTVGAYGITTCANTGIIFKDGNPGQLSAMDVIAIGGTFATGIVLIINGKFIKKRIIAQ